MKTGLFPDSACVSAAPQPASLLSYEEGKMQSLQPLPSPAQASISAKPLGSPGGTCCSSGLSSLISVMLLEVGN